MIDFHAHMGRIYREGYPEKHTLTVHQLIDWMNRHRVDQSVLLPLESPEGGWGYFLTEEAVEARNMYPERLIAFVCGDPRYPQVAQQIDHFVRHHGCKGFGEHVNGLAFDDPLNKVIYAKCDEHGLPLVFEISGSCCVDDQGLPRLESCLKEFRQVTFIGHGPAFWSAISALDDRRGDYPKGPVQPGGAVDRLLEEYDNLYADLSAYSGYNAMTRDPDFTGGFIQKHWRKLLWGTDYLVPHQEIPQVAWLASLDVTPEAREAIGDGNARRVLRLLA